MTVTALDSRRPILGGSTIAAAAGVDPWCSQVELFYRLRGELPANESEPLWWGRAVQPLIFEALRERGFSVHETPMIELRDDSLPWLAGHPDGVADRSRLREVDGKPYNDGAIVEAKLTGGYGYRKEAGLPLNWQAQVQTYMRLGRVDRALVAVLVAGIRLDVHEVVYDERACDLLFGLAEAFVELVRSDLPPLPDGSASARDALALRFPRQEPGRTYRLTGAEWDTAKRLRELREQKAEVERQITAAENTLKACDPEAETFLDPFDNTYATWREVKQTRFDTKLFKEERPELAGLFTRETKYRRFTVHD